MTTQRKAVKLSEQAAAPVAISDSGTILCVIQRAAADPQCDIEKMERLLQMHERMQDRQAEQQYAEALAIMQHELPSVAERGGIKDRNGRVQSTYALWEDINDAIKPILARHGFSLSFRTPRNDKGVEVEGVLSHRAGHSERTSIVLPADVSGSKNAVQAVASSVSYGKRYTAGALLNLTSHGEDDDAYASVPPAVITPIQAKALAALLERCTATTRDWFAGEYGTPADVPKAAHDRVTAALNKAIQKAAEQKANEQGAQQ